MKLASRIGPPPLDVALDWEIAVTRDRSIPFGCCTAADLDAAATHALRSGRAAEAALYSSLILCLIDLGAATVDELAPQLFIAVLIS